MKSIKNLNAEPAGLPILADDVLEFHAGRLLLLFKICGTANRISGLTKMAKLDFFVRYPQFFDVLCEKLGKRSDPSHTTVESSMVRFHYGPWDHRYYHVLPYLEAKGLLSVYREGKQFDFELTELGVKIAKQLAKDPAFNELSEHMKRVKKELGSKRGNTLKKWIYEVFDKEVAKRSLGEVIG
jgi:hypothetical protein